MSTHGYGSGPSAEALKSLRESLTAARQALAEAEQHVQVIQGHLASLEQLAGQRV